MKRIDFQQNWTRTVDGGKKVAVTLPDDASFVKGRDPKAASGKNGAYFLSGLYVYEKEFDVPADWKNKRVHIEFEGVYPRAEVYLNDQKIGGCQYGYSLFHMELVGLKAGEINKLRVVVDDTKHPNSRWYAGAGIYRPVWLLVGEQVHIVPNGIRVTTKSYEPAVVTVEVETVGSEDIGIEILQDDMVIARGEGTYGDIPIPDAKLWDAEHPNLYTCQVTLYKEGQSVDTQRETFGIRSLEWSAKGFFINGKSVLLKGGCIHHDNGILGARSYAEAEWRKVKRLKEFGFNAIRSAHNPLCRSMLEACDTLGMYVMDESWDTWYKTKNPYDFGNGFMERYETDLRQMVAKDYNHPSVVMYSVGNEVTEPAKKQGVKMLKTLVDTMHSLDRTRPITAGMNITLLLLAKLPFDPIALFAGGDKKEEETSKNKTEVEDSKDKKANEQKEQIKQNEQIELKKVKKKQEMSSEQYNAMMSRAGNGMQRVNAGFMGDMAAKCCSLLDITGYNYGTTRYEREGKKNPNRVIVGSETYCHEIAKVWPIVEEKPYIIGDFMWTAWDYLGEVGIGAYSYDKEDFVFEKKYPWKLAEAGAIDILGNDTAEAGLAKVVWNKSMKPYIGVTPANHGNRELAKAVWRGTNARPHWSYRDCEGAAVDVEIYSAADSVELFINGKSQGKKQLETCKAIFQVNYESGTIKAITYNTAGRAVGERELTSAEGRLSLQIMQEESHAPDNQNILYFNIAIVGENGQVECNQDQTLRADVSGGELLGFGSANPKTTERYTDGVYATYFGKIQAVVKKTQNSGCIRITDGRGAVYEAEF
jgi:hypothetical protein